jgi:hypothetical protein
VTDAVADVGGLRRVDYPDDLQLDPRRQFPGLSFGAAMYPSSDIDM